jgi:hypothetical protein
MTKVSEIDNVTVGEHVASLKRRIDRTITLTEATAVADIELPFGLHKQLSEARLLPKLS